MNNDFDKEIDALLRHKAREGESASAITQSELHFDADLISSFAEGALPEQARVLAQKHFADCNRCRKILSEVVVLNSNSEIEPENFIAGVAAVSTQTIPWHKKLFALPNLVYALAAGVVLFGGLIGFIALQNSGRDSELAKVTGVKSDSAPSASSNTASNSPDANILAEAANASSNTASSTNSPSAADIPSPQDSGTVSDSRESSGAFRIGRGGPLQRESTSNGIPGENVKEAEVAKTEAKPAAPALEDRAREEDKKIQFDGVDITTDSSIAKQNEPLVQNQSQSQIQNQTQSQTGVLMPDTQNSRRDSPAKKTTSGISSRQVDELPAGGRSVALQRAEKEKPASRSFGAKTFNSIDGVWIDSIYAGQKTKRVKRTSGDYKKLDADLRAIADDLGGTVIILWSSKAYRIQ